MERTKNEKFYTRESIGCLDSSPELPTTMRDEIRVFLETT
jgi:hypothetical protein